MDLSDVVNLGKGLGHVLIPDLLTGTTIVDGGASDGKFVEKLRELGISSHILSIEPARLNFNILKEKRLENVTLVNRALVGIGGLKVATYTEIDGLPEWGGIKGLYLNSKRVRSRKTEKYSIETITLDNLFKDYSLQSIDYLKLDIEGCETEVIMTMSSEMSKKVNQISLEIHNNDGEVLENKLKSFGYSTSLADGELYGVRACLL